MSGIPASHAHEDVDAGQRQQRHQQYADLPQWQDQDGDQQGADGRAEGATHLENGLRQPMLAGRCQAGDARGLWMEHRRTQADQGGRQQQAGKIPGERQQDQAQQGAAHAQRQGIGLRAAIGVATDQGLQQGGRTLEHQGDETDLHEAQGEFSLQHRIQRQQHRLHHVVDGMANADGAERLERHACRCRRTRADGIAVSHVH